jgi:dTDP-4-amino-4,6-dideoxy-D-galactose acyltransferase
MIVDDRLREHRIERLPWDSDHYGIAVARLNEPAPSPADLEACVRAARRSGIRLLYWLASPDAEIHDGLVVRLGGKRISGRVVYQRELEEADEDGLDELEGFRIEVYAGVRATRRLRNLAIEAGAYSRFQVDDRLPIGKFEEMYETWVEKSVAGELADEVVVATDAEGEVAGFVSFKVRGEAADIGLVSVHSTGRGRGVASALLRRAHLRMGKLGARTVTVATQAENEPACRLYASSGYRVCEAGIYYHFFWGNEVS